MDKYTVLLPPEERVELQRLITTGKAAARRLMHARILLLADHGDRSDEEVVSAVGASLRTVERVRKRLVTEGLDEVRCDSGMNVGFGPTREARVVGKAQ